jgi:hypothetical protein
MYQIFSNLVMHFVIPGASYHHSNSSSSRRTRNPNPEREKERDRAYARERDMFNYNDDELLNERGYDYGAGVINVRNERDVRNREKGHLDVGMMNNNRHLVNNTSNYDNEPDLLRNERDKDKERYNQQPQILQQSRRDRDEYSPHRGTNRRVLNAM